MVSIVLVTYNRASRLKLSIQDILRQTFRDFELIICDDCSTDTTKAVCEEFQKRDPRITYYRHPSNIAMPANCNFGIQKARFDYIAILHDGDRFKPDLIEQWYTAISKHDVGFVFNSIGETDAQDNLVSANCYHAFPEGVVQKDLLLKKTFFRRWQFDSPVYGQAMVKKELVEQMGLLNSRFGFYADVDLWMELLHSHDAYCCLDTLITTPTKDIQPRLFDDNLINFFLLMFSMHLKHRKKAYAGQPVKLGIEMTILWIQSLFNVTYRLLLVVKNFSLGSFLDAGTRLKRNALFLIPWTVIFLLYPVLYPILKLFTIIKQNFRKRAGENPEPSPLNDYSRNASI